MENYTNKKYEDVVKKGCYGVLYNNAFGGFSISNDGCELLYAKFPNKELIFKKNSKGALSCRHREIRTDQDVIKYMLELGLYKFEAKYCSLAIENIPIGIDYKTDEYDGAETILFDINKKLVINDLCVRLAKMETLLYAHGVSDLTNIGQEDKYSLTEEIIKKGYDKYISELNELCGND